MENVKGGDSIKVLFEKLVKSNEVNYWLFIILIVLVEVFFTFLSISIGAIIYLAILMSLLIAALLKYQKPCYQLFSALAIIPLIRIISVSLPMTGLSELLKIVFVSLPLFITGIIIAKITSITPKILGFTTYKLHIQLLISLIGLPLGLIKFYIIKPKLINISVAPVEILMWVITLIFCVGLLEEFLFRGILFNVAGKFLSNNKAMYFISLLYAALTISSKSFFNVIYAFMISLLFCRIFIWKKSIIGISLAHGIINITFYLICPQIF
ncbi:MAG: CPBP family intramembrane metalloprotease [Anaerolineaceae bacterium]|nr:MAG: CPBP family intramembrane metalloprotease [Anaerolineaceae bacterium]